MTTIPVRRLAEVFVELADTLVDDFDLIEFLQTLATRTAELVDVAAVGILLADNRGRIQFAAASDEATRLLELYQLQNREGPCLDAFTTRTPVVNADLRAAAGQWPLFAPAASRRGFRSVHAFPLRLRGEVIGALNLFGSDAGGLDGEHVSIVQALADIATIGLLQERSVRRAEDLTAQLQTALTSRITIEQAKGALARIHDVDVDEAFLLLRSHARRNGIPLVELSRSVVAGVEPLPGLTDRPDAPAAPGARRRRRPRPGGQGGELAPGGPEG